MNKYSARRIIILVLCLVLIPAATFAATPTSGGSNNNSSAASRINSLPVFKFWNHEKGIGYGNCPVYTAPSYSAYRLADGKASVATNVYMSEGGYVSGWLLVRYEKDGGGFRVGYIPPSNVSGFRSKMGTKQFDYVAATAGGTIYVTDDPIRGTPYFARMDYGERFYLLARYDYYGDWLYIEFWVNGQVARGFIDRTSSNFSLY